MKVLMTCFILALSLTLFAQSKTDKIGHVRQVFKAINKDTTLKKVVLDNEALSKYRPENENPDGGEELTGYFRRDTLVKIIYDIGLSVRNIKTEYYLENGKTLFVFEDQRNFPFNDKTGEMDHGKLEPGFEGRYYLDKDIIIQKIEKGTPRGDKGRWVRSLRSDLSKYSKLLLKAYLKRKSK